MPLKQSLCYPIFQVGGISLEALIAEAARVGYAAVEMWGRGADFEDVLALARAHNLVVASMCGHGTLAEGLNRRDQHDRIADELRVSIDLAARHGIPGLICFSGNRQPDQPEADALAATAEGLARVAPQAERQGVTLNMELLNSKVDHPGYQCDHTAWGVAVCQRVNSPRVKLLYDIYHMQVMEGDIIRTLREQLHWIGHIHTAGNPGRHALDDNQELYYPAIFRALAAAGYTGFVGHELIPTGDPLEALRHAFAVGQSC